MNGILQAARHWNAFNALKYEKKGYQTLRHDKWNVENKRVLVYEIMAKPLPHTSTGIFYDGRLFVLRENTENGEVDGNTVFAYHQRDNILWADYSGGEIARGYLVGTVSESGELDFYYKHINKQNRYGWAFAIACRGFWKTVKSNWLKNGSG